MKQILLFIAALTLLTTSCSKEENATPVTPIEIAGTTYNVIKIGTQQWTTTNYNGTGGVDYNNGTNNPDEGKLYSYTEATAIGGLPKGWRVPNKSDVLKLIKELTGGGTNTDLDGEIFLDDQSKKVISKTGWSIISNSEKGINELGLDIKATGYYFSSTSGSFKGKGTSGSFWTSTREGNNVLYFEIASDTWYNNQQSLRGYIIETTLDGASSHPTFVEKRPIRFVKDN